MLPESVSRKWKYAIIAATAASIGAVALILGITITTPDNSSPSGSSSAGNTTPINNSSEDATATTFMPSSMMPTQSSSMVAAPVPSTSPFLSTSTGEPSTNLVTLVPSNVPTDVVIADPIIQICKITGTDALGPFYTENPPALDEYGKLSPPNEPGVPIHVTGRLRRTDSVTNECDDALDNWTVDLWQADADGVYDNSGGYHLRGTVMTNATGYYEFRSILPGRYVPRPRHVHFRIWSDFGLKQDELVSQMYFGDDEAEIASLQMSYPGRVVVLDSAGRGQFDIHFDLAA